jgi:hypothetical protein
VQLFRPVFVQKRYKKWFEIQKQTIRVFLNIKSAQNIEKNRPKVPIATPKNFVKTRFWKTIKGEIFEIDTCKKNLKYQRFFLKTKLDF